ncbi:MAG: hypothetical protein HQL38_20200, partial [Alphaproteobacteria bacterium]|nr:hypothetical protein [Alphaproteobacteria bacterium]
MDVLTGQYLSWSDRSGAERRGGYADLIAALVRREVSDLRVPFDGRLGLWSSLFTLGLAVALDAGRDGLEPLSADGIASVLRDRAEREGLAAGMGPGMGAKAFRLTGPRDEVAFMQVAITSRSAATHKWKPFTLKAVPDHTANFRGYDEALPPHAALAALVGYKLRAWGVAAPQFKNVNQAPVHVYILPNDDIGSRFVREIDIVMPSLMDGDGRPMFGWIGAWPEDASGTRPIDDFHSYALVPCDPMRLVRAESGILAEEVGITKRTIKREKKPGRDDEKSDEKDVMIRYVADEVRSLQLPWTALSAGRSSPKEDFGKPKPSSPGDFGGFSIRHVLSLLNVAAGGEEISPNGKRRLHACRHLTSKLPIPANSHLVLEGFAYSSSGNKTLYPIGVRLAFPTI